MDKSLIILDKIESYNKRKEMGLLEIFILVVCNYELKPVEIRGVFSSYEEAKKNAIEDAETMVEQTNLECDEDEKLMYTVDDLGSEIVSVIPEFGSNANDEDILFYRIYPTLLNDNSIEAAISLEE